MIHLLDTKYGNSHVPSDVVNKIIEEIFDVASYRMVRVQVIHHDVEQPSHLLVRLFSKETRSYTFARVDIDHDYNPQSVSHDYHLTALDHSSQPNIKISTHFAPEDLNSIQFLSICPNKDYRENNFANEVAAAAQNHGYITKTLLDSAATTEAILQYLQAPNLVGCFYDGDANPHEIVTFDGALTPQNVSTHLSGKLVKVTGIWLACEAFNDPMLSAMTKVAQSQVYAAGINKLQVGPSDRTAVCAMKAALAGKPMKASFEACRQANDNKVDKWGYYQGGCDYLGEPWHSGYATSLPDTGSNIVSVLPSGSHVFYGSDGHCFKIGNNGAILNTNDLPDRGDHEVRLAISADANTLYLGTDGYALALSSSDLSTIWQTSLPDTGDNIVTPLVSSGYLYTGSAGHVFKLDGNGKIVATNNLPDRGDHEVRLAMSTDGSTLYVGTDGYALALAASDLTTRWQTSLPSTGSNIVSVLYANGYLCTGSNGHVYKLDGNGKIVASNNLPDRGRHEIRFALSQDRARLFVGTDGYALALSSSNLATLWQTSLPDTGSNVVSIVNHGYFLYAGSNGYVYALNSQNGTINYTNNLSDRGHHEVRVAVANNTLYLGTDGYALSVNICP